MVATDIERMWADGCPHPDAKKYGEGLIKPNGNKYQCQCVMCHCGAYVDGTTLQCTGRRWADSNQFCMSCEKMHGERWRQMYGAPKERKEPSE